MRSALALLLLVAPVPAQTGLENLPALARARAERLRPRLAQMMEPYWADLALRYRDSPEFLEGRIDEVVALGDTVVPLLLEQLRPQTISSQTRNLAGNCRRVLQNLDPDSFLDALIEIIQSGHEVGRYQALLLLGSATSPRALQALERALADGLPSDHEALLWAFARHRAKAPAQKLVKLLGSQDSSLRRATLDYLIAAAPADVAPTVLQALTQEAEVALIPYFVDYFGAATPANDDVARALLPMLDGGRLDWQDSLRLIRSLATIAPQDHEPTRRRLHRIVEEGETGALGLEAALALRSIGDKNGVKRLQSKLTDLLRKAPRRQEAYYYEQRGDLYFAIEDYKLAADDYEKVLDTSNSSLLSRKIHKQIARCEASRRRWSAALRQLQQVEPTQEEMLALAEEDPAIAEALGQDKLKRWFASLPTKR